MRVRNPRLSKPGRMSNDQSRQYQRVAHARNGMANPTCTAASAPARVPRPESIASFPPTVSNPVTDWRFLIPSLATPTGPSRAHRRFTRLSTASAAPALAVATSGAMLIRRYVSQWDVWTSSGCPKGVAHAQLLISWRSLHQQVCRPSCGSGGLHRFGPVVDIGAKPHGQRHSRVVGSSARVLHCLSLGWKLWATRKR